VFSLAGCSSDFATYEGNGFTIPYPKGWDVVLPMDSPGPNEDTFVLFHNIDPEYDIVTDYIIVRKEYLQQSMTAYDYFISQVIQDLSWREGYWPIETRNFTLDGRASIEHFYRLDWTNDLGDLKVEQTYVSLYVVDGMIAWIIDFYPGVIFDEYDDSVLGIISCGFHILN